MQHRGKPTQDWDFEALRHMGKTADYKSNTPDGYGEHIEYLDGDGKVNTPDWKVGEKDEIYKMGKELSSESEHVKELYPNADTLKAPEKDTKPKGIYKSNMTGEVPSTVAKSLVVIGGGAVQITN